MSRILFPEGPTGASTSYQSHKATYRPGKIPKLGRTNSVISLPSPQSSPPPEHALQASFLERDGSDTDISGSEEHVGDGLIGRGAAGLGRNFRNPFSRLAREGNLLAARPERPDLPQSSPTQHARRKRNDKDRIPLGDKLVVEEKVEVAPIKDGRGLGSDDLYNPFIVKPGEQSKWVAGKSKRPENVTYVFRGKRITYDIPFSSFLASDDPSESPFPIPSPRLLFPPAPPVTPPMTATPSSSFLDALRGTIKPDPNKQAEQKGINYGLPTPVRERVRKNAENIGGRFSPAKKARRV